jgi:hypothetical protein
MTRTLIFLLLAAATCAVHAQSGPYREAGLAFHGLNHFGVIYRTGTADRLWRFNSSFVTGNNEKSRSDNQERIIRNFNGSLWAGREYRKSLHEKIQIRTGFDISLDFRHWKQKTDDLTVFNNDDEQSRTTWRPGVNAVIGMNYLISDRMLVGFELLPGIGYVFGTEMRRSAGQNREWDISGFDVDLSNSAMLTFVLRW